MYRAKRKIDPSERSEERLSVTGKQKAQSNEYDCVCNELGSKQSLAGGSIAVKIGRGAPHRKFPR